MEVPLYHSKGCGFYLEVDGESLKKAGKDSDKIHPNGALVPCGTWRCADVLG